MLSIFLLPVFPQLEALELGAIEMWSGPVLPPAQFCPKLKSVGVVGATLSKHATFLHGLHNLETLTVQDSGKRRQASLHRNI